MSMKDTHEIFVNNLQIYKSIFLNQFLYYALFFIVQLISPYLIETHNKKKAVLNILITFLCLFG